MIGSDPVYAFIGALANNFTTVTAAIDNLCVSTEEDNLCGAFATDCRVVLDTTDTVVGSLRYELTYRGPPDYASLPFNCNAGEPCPTAWGVFNRTGVAYSDATCTVAVLTFSEQGALANLGRSLFGDTGSANAYGKFPRTIDVTPLDADTAADLQLQCPCSTLNVASWTANTARTITSVPYSAFCLLPFAIVLFPPGLMLTYVSTLRPACVHQPHVSVPNWKLWAWGMRFSAGRARMPTAPPRLCGGTMSKHLGSQSMPKEG